jgi:hypothetical protein
MFWFIKMAVMYLFLGRFEQIKLFCICHILNSFDIIDKNKFAAILPNVCHLYGRTIAGYYRELTWKMKWQNNKGLMCSKVKFY